VIGQQVSDRRIEDLAQELGQSDPPVFPTIDRVPLGQGLEVLVASVPARQPEELLRGLGLMIRTGCRCAPPSCCSAPPTGSSVIALSASCAWLVSPRVPVVPPEAITAAIDELTRDRSAMSLEAANRGICRLLMDGIPVSLPDREHGGQNAERLRVADWEDPERGGVFWQTQGSGKSFAMVFFAQKVLQSYRCCASSPATGPS